MKNQPLPAVAGGEEPVTDKVDTNHYRRILAKEWNRGNPLSANFELTFRCNLKCEFCYNVDDPVVAPPIFREIFFLIINHMVGAQRAHHVQFLRAIHASHICPDRLGHLYRKRAHTATCSIDQDFFSRLYLSTMA